VTRPDPILTRAAPQGRPVDRLIAIIAALGLVVAIGTTLWFFLGFVETDPQFAPASSAFLLSLLLGGFAITPCAVILRLSWTAWRTGFRLSHGFWTLFLMAPWIVFSGVASASAWMPFWLTLAPLLVAIPATLWATVSLILERFGSKKR
jgi:hypothetical protein